MSIVKYTARDGQSVELTFEVIKRFLVQGKQELVTQKEMVYFMGICKSRGLNPFIKDCYLIKYDNSPAAIITSIDYFRKRAKAQKDCRGWSKGVIVLRNEKIIYTQGLTLDTDELLGGWFEAKPSTWDEPFRLEVNLKGYIKTKRDGSVTQFWSKENQPAQIAKVAESQGLRTLWPDEFQQMYTPEEMGEPEMFKDAEMAVGGTSDEEIEMPDEIPEEEVSPVDIDAFNRKIKSRAMEVFGKHPDFRKKTDLVYQAVGDHLKDCAKINDTTTEAVMKAALEDFNSYWEQVKKWIAPLFETIEDIQESEEEPPIPIEDKAKVETLIDESADFICSSFARLKGSGLVKYEEVKRDIMLDWPEKAQQAFIDKWGRIFGENYVIGKGPVVPAEAEKEEQKEINSIICPDEPDKPTVKNFCEGLCPRGKERCDRYYEAWGA